MRDYVVYLAGPIAGLTYGEGQDWREAICKLFPDEIKGMSPLRAKSQRLARAGIINDSYEDCPLTSQAGITMRDRNDCMRADAVVFNMLGAKTVSIGTCIEFGWADAFRRPTVLIMEPTGNLHDHPMVKQVSGFRCYSIEEAAQVVEAVLLPAGHRADKYSGSTGFGPR